MKRLLVPLCAVTGCNWVFGLEQAVPWDAQPVEVLPPGPRTTLEWAVATSDGMPIKQPGVPAVDPMLVYAAIGSEAARPEKPTILVGDDNGVMPGEYASDGSFEIPYALRESPHRIIYTLPGESAAHEVQWALTGARITVPRTTRLNAPAVPSGSGYTIAPPNNTNSYSAPSLYTSGVTTLNSDDFEQTGPAGEITFRFANAKPVAGPLGAPQASVGDWVLLTDWVSRTASQSSIDGWALASAELTAGQMTMPSPQPTWNTTETTYSTLMCPGANCMPSFNSAETAQRLATTLGGLAGTASGRMAYGVSPSTELPGFLPGVAPTYVERPLLFPFLESTVSESTMTLADPSDAVAYKRVLFSRFASTRTVNGVALTSSINTITDNFNGSVQYPAPLVVSMKLGDVMIDKTAADAAPVPASSGFTRLSFDQEAGAGVASADDFVVTLYQITGTAMAPVRYYHVIQPSVKIDGSLLAAGQTYVIGITARSGYPDADRGNYSKATYPFGSSTTFTRTFVIQ